MRFLSRIVGVLALGWASVRGQEAAWPARRATDESGAVFAQRIQGFSLAEREAAVLAAVERGNVPESWRTFVPVTVRAADGSGPTVVFQAVPDYLAVGSEEDALPVPLTPAAAQRVADALGCVLPTPKMVDAVWAAAPLKLEPLPIPPNPAMTTVPVFVEHARRLAEQRRSTRAAHPPGTLVAGGKKDVVVTARLANATNRVAIYGWHRTNGAPIQPLSLVHGASYVDYSHGVRLVRNDLTVDGTNSTVARVLADPALAPLLSGEGVVETWRYPGAEEPIAWRREGTFGEQAAEFRIAPEVRVRLVAPLESAEEARRPVLLVVYALPNGNGIDQTLGRRPGSTNEWRFDLQHAAAQTRFLRAALPERTVVLACLETDGRSWPAWRRKHGDAEIPRILERVKAPWAGRATEVVLTGHSGGGSFTFGYLNRVERIPEEVVRIAFLDSNYAYDASQGHARKLAEWLRAGDRRFLAVLAYDDANALLNGKPFVSAVGGTWGRSQAMLADLGRSMDFTGRTNAAGLGDHRALGGRVAFLLQENPERKVLHTVQVDRNGLIHGLLVGTALEQIGYTYFGERAYERWIEAP